MENNQVFFIIAGGVAVFTILNLMRKTDIVQDLKNQTPRVDYFQKGQNSSAKNINLGNLISYYSPRDGDRQPWTASQTKADRAKILTASHSSNKDARNTSTEYITKHMLRTGTGKTGPAARIYDYYG